MKESDLLVAYGQRAVNRRRLASYNAERAHKANTRFAAYAAQGAFLEKSLAYLGLDHFQLLGYVQDRTRTVDGPDSQESIQVVCLSNKQLFLHRIKCKELLEDFETHFMGYWSESNHPRDIEKVIQKVKQLLLDRAENRRVNPALDFGSGS